jgi:hypothetical protein
LRTVFGVLRISVATSRIERYWDSLMPIGPFRGKKSIRRNRSHGMWTDKKGTMLLAEPRMT